MNNFIRSSNRLPFDFEDGLKVQGVNISTLVERLINESNSRTVINSVNITNALGYTPVSKNGDTMNGSLTINGNLIASGDVTAYSDESLKTDWTLMCSNFIEKLSKVKAGTFTRKADQGRCAGVSAQSLKEVMPECVILNDDGLLSVAYGNAALVATVELAKEAVCLNQNLFESLNKQNQLEDTVARMKEQIDILTAIVNKLTR